MKKKKIENPYCELLIAFIIVAACFFLVIRCGGQCKDELSNLDAENRFYGKAYKVIITE